MKSQKIRKVFGVVVSKLRKENKLSQEELSTRSKVSRPHLSCIESGKTHPTLVTIYQLSKSLNIDPNKLLYLVDNILKKTN